MVSTISQQNRMGSLHSPFGDSLALLEFSGTEAVNAPFEFRVVALSGAGVLDGDKVLGARFAVEIDTIDGGKRAFHGIAVSMLELGPEQGGIAYQLELRPWFWLLRHRQNCRIFHEKAVKDIFETIFREYGDIVPKVTEIRLSGQYPELEYTVQYRESDYDFVCRLMETYGINYHFVTARDWHQMVLTDRVDSFKAVSGGSRPFHAVTGRNRSDSEHFSEWSQQRVATTGATRLKDYNFKTSTRDLTAEAAANGKYPGGKLESYDYPGPYLDAAHGKAIAQRRMDAMKAANTRFSAVGDALSIAPGQLMTLTEHDTANGRYVVLSCAHRFVAEAYRSGSGGGSSYGGRYGFAPADAPLAPPPVTPRARVHGPQTGVVIGEGEIDCDEFGRILVMFHWDSESAGSMRCRVAQLWAGNKWGAIYTPRIGMEVVVEFLEGDPDRPLVTGAVYNDKNMPPFDLPQKKTISGVKSYSTLGGGGYNSLTFDDAKGKELIEMHAQYNHEVLVENDYKGTTRGFSTEEVHKDMKLTVKQARESKIDRSDKLNVGTTLEIEAGSKIVLKVGGSSIEMDGLSIKLTATSISVDAKADLKTGGGMMAEHKAGAMMDIKAAMVKINS
ncbi:MAG: type VI secretion system tip protein VgrG [Defluviimonas sp.]|nr:type VI secretion system tip protein VgrG [Defluviimonas sp.]